MKERIHFTKYFEPRAINKWGYAFLVGVICMAYAEEPGGLDGFTAFWLGAVVTYFSILSLEFILALARFIGKRGESGLNRHMSKLPGRDDD